MASNVGLFTSPEQVLQAEQQLRQQQALRGGFSPISAAAQELGRSVSGAFGKAVGGEGLVSQPAEMARNRMQVLQSADISTREGAFSAATALRDAGDMEGFAKLTQHGLGISPPPAAKAPSTRNIREGKNIVNQEWNPQTRSWHEVGRGPLGGGSNITINSEDKTWARVHDRYEKAIKPVVEKRATVDAIKATANTPGGAASQALQTSIANLFGGNVRALAELNRWATFGNLPDRMINSATRFLGGEYSEEGKSDVLTLLRNYETHVLNKQQDDVNERFMKIGLAAEVPLEFFIRDTPMIRNLDFSKMSLEELSSIDPNVLELDEKRALEERLIKEGF